MKPYHKIQTIFKRDPDNRHKTLLIGQYSMREFSYLAGLPWVMTEKVDGTNVRVVFDGDRVTFKGKTDNAQMPPALLASLEATFGEPAMLKAMRVVLPEGACLYGEGYGPGIQNGGKYRPSASFVMFDVRIGEWWLGRDDVNDIAHRLGLDAVPVVGECDLSGVVRYVQSRPNSLWGEFPAEGVVARPKVELCTRGGERIITKLKVKDFAEPAQ